MRNKVEFEKWEEMEARKEKSSNFCVKELKKPTFGVLTLKHRNELFFLQTNLKNLEK